MNNFILWIDNEFVFHSDLHRYSIRFVQTGISATPVLYRDGKRVVKSWNITLSHNAAADPAGGNANTE